MWRLLTSFRERVEARHTPVRRPRRHRPHGTHLEDRCLLSVNLTESGPTVPLVGSPVVWTATASGHGTTPVYQFSVGPDGGVAHVVRDFSTFNTFTWNPMQEGTYDIRVIVKDSFSASTGESATAKYTAQSRVTGTGAVVSPMSNPLVALYSAPPSPGSSMYVQFAQQGPSPSWKNTATLPIVPGESTNFIVAGMLPNTTYLMRHVMDDGTVSAPLTFTTGSLPRNLTFPGFTVPQAPASGTDLTQDTIFHMGLPGSTSSTVATLATDLKGNVVWYYDPVTNGPAIYATTLVPGGTVLLFVPPGGVGAPGALREIDLAGDALRETNINAVNAELAALGQQPINDFNHDIQLLPNGDMAVLARAPRTIDVNGTPTAYNGDMVIVLDPNLQVVWAWDPFKWLDTSRLGTDGEGPGDWLHANSIAWSPADQDLIVSMRSQDWVVKINYANGTGDGHVIWRLGQGGNFTITDATDPSDPYPWFSHQHDARYINDTTLVLFDDGNTRVDKSSDPDKESRGQELVLNEQTMTATLVVNADLGNYSFFLGSAQVLPNGNLDFTSGGLSSPSGSYGQSIEVLPDGTRAYVQQMNGLNEYRSYFMSTLYGPSTSARFLKQDASKQGNWIGAYGAQGYDIAATAPALPSYATVSTIGASSGTWAASTTDVRALRTPDGSGRAATFWTSPTAFTIDVNLADDRAHDLALYALDWDNRGRQEQIQVLDAATGVVLHTESISSFANGVYLQWAITGHVQIKVTNLGPVNAVISGLFLDPAPLSIWNGATTPSWVDANDNRAVELGVRITPAVSGYITGLQFYKGPLNTGAHVADLWTSTGQLLATATFANETASGWQQVNFATPVAVTAGTTYVASYHTNVGQYADAYNYFASAYSSGPLQVPAGGGVYAYGPAGSFPRSSYRDSNYWVDVVLAAAPPAVTRESPAAGATGVAVNAPVAATFNEPVQPRTIRFTLTGPGGAAVPAALGYNASTDTATLTPLSSLAAATTYTATISGAQDVEGDVMVSPVSWSFTTSATYGPGPFTIWSAAATPQVADANDSSPVELGVRFTPAVSGTITGLRFYKGPLNTGAHVADLWSSTGTLLATATFTGETASGWQQVNFTTPVAVTAGTTYVASYHTNVGQYAFDKNYFATAYSSGPLHVPANGGVYAYGAAGTFPRNSYLGSNYWVDVVLSTSTAPAVTGESPAAGATGVAVNAPVAATFNEAVQPGTIRLTPTGPGGAAVPAAIGTSRPSVGGAAVVSGAVYEGAAAGLGPGRVGAMIRAASSHGAEIRPASASWSRPRAEVRMAARRRGEGSETSPRPTSFGLPGGVL